MSDVPFVTKPKIIYLDNNATTACSPEVVEAMMPYWGETFGNEASAHFAGRQAHRAIENVRQRVADAVHAKPHQIFFNSGATEGNNWIFQSLALSGLRGKRVVVSAIEHKSVLNAAKALERQGCDIAVLPVDSNGVVSLEAARKAITAETVLVSVQLANNETGTIQPVGELAALAHSVGAFFHCDIVQGVGKMKVDLATLAVDSAVFSGHKIHGPKGVGVLYLAGGAGQYPWTLPLHGGGQEHDIRPGTMNTPGIVGIGKAVELLPDDSRLEKLLALRTLLESELKRRFPYCVIHGEHAPRIPNTTNVAFPGIPSDILMANLPLFCVSNGSACNSGSIAPSYVLRAMGVGEEEARRSIRISTSTTTTSEEIVAFVDAVETAFKNLPQNSVLY